jgi:HIV Tat-specific factor 1
MFEPKDFESEPKLILEYRTDLRDECSEKCGPVKRVDIYDCHPEGVAAITFNDFECADQCVSLMNGRFFAGRKLSAHVWDGKTKYKIEETEEEAEKRIKQWDQFLESNN